MAIHGRGIVDFELSSRRNKTIKDVFHVPNSVVERRNRSIISRVRAMLLSSKVIVSVLGRSNEDINLPIEQISYKE